VQDFQSAAPSDDELEESLHCYYLLITAAPSIYLERFVELVEEHGVINLTSLMAND